MMPPPLLFNPSCLSYRLPKTSGNSFKPWVCAFHPKTHVSTLQCPSSPSRHITPISCSSEYVEKDKFTFYPDDNNTLSFEEQYLDGMNLLRKDKKLRYPYAAEWLPFDVCTIEPNPRLLGKFRLDPGTHTGDTLEYQGSFYVVKKVRFHYEFAEGGYKVYKKTVEVKSLTRRAIESELNKLYYDDSE